MSPRHRDQAGARLRADRRAAGAVPDRAARHHRPRDAAVHRRRRAGGRRRLPGVGRQRAGPRRWRDCSGSTAARRPSTASGSRRRSRSSEAHHGRAVVRRREVAGSTWFAIAVGGLAPIAVGGRCSCRCATRSTTPTSRSSSCSSWWSPRSSAGARAGALAAVTSTLAFDFFLTRPFLSARIESADDIETLLILLAVGLLVGEVAVAGTPRPARPRSGAAERGHGCTGSPTQVAHGRAAGRGAGAGADRAARPVRAVGLLARAARRSAGCCPRMDRGGTVEGDEHEWLDAASPSRATAWSCRWSPGARRSARLVLLGDPDTPASLDQRVRRGGAGRPAGRGDGGGRARSEIDGLAGRTRQSSRQSMRTVRRRQMTSCPRGGAVDARRVEAVVRRASARHDPDGGAAALQDDRARGVLVGRAVVDRVRDRGDPLRHRARRVEPGPRPEQARADRDRRLRSCSRS